MDMLKKVPVREQDPKVRAGNFEEVCYGYNAEEAQAEAARCLKCKNAKCMGGCPVSIDIPGFIRQVETGDFEAAANVIAEASALPAVCGRVCPQESQCFHRKVRAICGGLVQRAWICAQVSRGEEREKGGSGRFWPGRTYLCRGSGQVRL